jgi:hypothetical protein
MEKLQSLVEYVKANRVKAAVVAGSLAAILMVAADHTIAYAVGEYLVKVAEYLKAP